MSAKSKNKFSVSFDSPVTLIFVFLLILVAIFQRIFPQISFLFFCPTRFGTASSFNYKSVADYFRILLYPFGFSSWNFLISNLVFILLLCPKVESVFGKLITTLMLLLTIVFAGVVCVCFGTSVIYGTSGIVCMLLILSLYISIDKKSIPLSFILVAIIYITREVIQIIDTNSLEIFCHFAGSLAGSLVGILSISFGSKK